MRRLQGHVRSTKNEGETPGLKIAINSTPTHYFGTRYPIECQKMSYTLYIVSKMLYTLYIVSKSVLYIQLVAIFNPGVSLSEKQGRGLQGAVAVLCKLGRLVRREHARALVPRVEDRAQPHLVP